MGIDIYAQWAGMTDAERNAQVTGFDATMGRVGYLREAYHGRPYATRFLVQEAFAAPDGRAQIPAKVLRDRLPLTIDIARIRERVVYGDGDAPAFDEDVPAVAAVAKTLKALGWKPTRPHGTSGTTEDAVVRSYIEFVELCERKEAETGGPVTILASY